MDDGERAQRGTAILVPDSFRICMSRISGTGRWAMAAIVDESSHDSVTVIVSLYAPNCHRTSIVFFDEFFNSLDDFCEAVAEQYQWPQVVIAGDFNFVFDPTRDSLNRQQSQTEATLTSVVANHLEERELVDSALCLEQASPSFTWRRANCCSRLDYILTSTGLSSRISSVQTEWFVFGSSYDHASVTIKFVKEIGIPRGRGYPKLFQADIGSPRDCLWLADRLDEANAQIPQHWNPHQSHEFLKMITRSKALELRAMNRKQSSSLAITDKINQLLQSPSDEAIREVEQLKIALLQAEEAELEVLRLRAGIKWREQGERSSKYFLGRLKTRELARDMHNLVDHNGQVIQGIQGILNHVKSFFANLYQAPREQASIRVADDQFFEHCPVLDPVQQQQLSSPITLEELKETLKTCKDSAPGLDGIPYSYYKIYENLLLPLIIKSWEYSNIIGTLPESQALSVISLIPKAGKDKHELKNWRPISISSCDLTRPGLVLGLRPDFVIF